MYQLLFKPLSQDLDSSIKEGIELIINGMRKSN